MLQQQTGDDYVLATNETHTVREFCELSAKELGINLTWQGEGLNEKGVDKDTGEIIIELDEKYFRPAEVDLLIGDTRKAYNKLGWKSKTSFNDFVKIMVLEDLKLESHKES